MEKKLPNVAIVVTETVLFPTAKLRIRAIFKLSSLTAFQKKVKLYFGMCSVNMSNSSKSEATGILVCRL